MDTKFELDELNFLDEIDSIESQYYNYNKKNITNVSDWNPSYEFKSEICEILAENYTIDNIDYIFSYTQSWDRKNDVLNRLGFNANSSILFTHSGSASILNCINFLHSKNINRLVILCPAYFTVFYACKIYGIECIKVYLNRNDYGYNIDYSILLKYKSKNTAFWITNPVYCTSVYYKSNMIEIFKSLLETNIVVFDENLCVSSKELSWQLGRYDNFVGIYSPHKSICINGNKFSVVIASKGYQDFFDAWSDVLCGCLSTGNDIAISHYLSDNFSKYNSAFLNRIIHNKFNIENICKTEGVDFDEESYGYLITVFFQNINANIGINIKFIEDIMFNTGIRFIPGKRNHFCDNMGFCFRINLATYNDKLYHTLKHAFKYINNGKWDDLL